MVNHPPPKFSAQLFSVGRFHLGPLLDSHAWLCAAVRAEDVDAGGAAAAIRGGQYHAFGQAEFHLAWSEVGDHDGQAADELAGVVGGFNAGKDVAWFFFADVECQAYQLVRTLDMLSIGDTGDAQVDFHEIVDGA